MQSMPTGFKSPVIGIGPLKTLHVFVFALHGFYMCLFCHSRRLSRLETFVHMSDEVYFKDL